MRPDALWPFFCSLHVNDTFLLRVSVRVSLWRHMMPEAKNTTRLCSRMLAVADPHLAFKAAVMRHETQKRKWKKVRDHLKRRSSCQAGRRLKKLRERKVCDSFVKDDQMFNVVWNSMSHWSCCCFCSSDDAGSFTGDIQLKKPKQNHRLTECCVHVTCTFHTIYLSKDYLRSNTPNNCSAAVEQQSRCSVGKFYLNKSNYFAKKYIFQCPHFTLL